MSLVMAIKDRKTNKYIVASDGMFKSDTCSYSKYSPRTLNIQKFKNFIVAYNCNAPLFEKLVETVDLDSLPLPLTKGILYEKVYIPLMNIILDNKFEILDKNHKTLRGFDFELIILASNGVFDICDTKIYHTDDGNEFYGSGQYAPLFGLYDAFYNEMDTLDLIKLMFRETSQKFNDVGYPHLFVYQDSDELHKIDKDNNEEIIKMEELFRRNK